MHSTPNIHSHRVISRAGIKGSLALEPSADGQGHQFIIKLTREGSEPWESVVDEIGGFIQDQHVAIVNLFTGPHEELEELLKNTPYLYNCEGLTNLLADVEDIANGRGKPNLNTPNVRVIKSVKDQVVLICFNHLLLAPDGGI
jgi:hypothetical protein